MEHAVTQRGGLVALGLYVGAVRWMRSAVRPSPWSLHVAQVSGEARDGSSLPRSASVVGDECERFIRQHERPILNYIWRVTGDEQTAYDLTQEVFLRAWQHFDAISRYEQPRGWLFKVASNLALTHLRRRARQPGSIAALDEEHGPSTSDPAWRLAETDNVRAILLQLSPKRRAALVLREVYGLHAAEIGQSLGMTETAVRMSLHRGREQFREIYLREGGTRHGA